mmetsp:Transcript_23455/g.32808  ORF Transcript_23455/g.32808 Transcript_23455/m.32808 type:complete len:140 (-) Transcript_23455:53-472(-)
MILCDACGNHPESIITTTTTTNNNNNDGDDHDNDKIPTPPLPSKGDPTGKNTTITASVGDALVYELCYGYEGRWTTNNHEKYGKALQMYLGWILKEMHMCTSDDDIQCNAGILALMSLKFNDFVKHEIRGEPVPSSVTR